MNLRIKPRLQRGNSSTCTPQTSAQDQVDADGQDWESGDDPLCQLGATKMATDWLRRMDEYLHGTIQQLTTIAESEQPDSSARAASLLLQDVVLELEGVAKAAEDADAAGVPATYDDGHAGGDATLANLAAGGSLRSAATDVAAADATETSCPRRESSPSDSSTTSTSSASSGAINGRSSAHAAALTSALTEPDPDVTESRSADRTYLNSLSCARSDPQPIMTHSILPYETYWLGARGV